jgi:hypothetical protein
VVLIYRHISIAEINHLSCKRENRPNSKHLYI